MRPRLALFLLCTISTTALAQDVQFRLSLKDGKSTYRSGEPIGLVLSFSATHEGYSFNGTTTKPQSPIDRIEISPDSGVAHWLDDSTGGNRYSPDYAMMSTLSAEPVTVELTLNDLVRFDGPGPYSVRVKTNRVSTGSLEAANLAPLPLTSNEVTFDVTPMTDAEEQSEVARLLSAISTAHRAAASRDRAVEMAARKDEERYAEELSYLAGDDATRAKIHAYLSAARPQLSATNGLFIARNPELALASLEAALRDPDNPVSVELLATTARLRVLIDKKPDKQTDPSAATEKYVAELIASLPRRSAKSQTTTAMTILAALPKDHTQAAAVSASLREILVRQFDQLGAAQTTLLRAHWDLIRDPSLRAPLEAMVKRFRGPGMSEERGLALKRLIELSPERARPLVIAEISDPSSLLDYDVLAAWREPLLPETDASLLDQIRQQASLERRHALAYKAALAARFASSAIYQPLREIYRTSSAQWTPEERASLLGYFARINDAEAAPMVEHELAALPAGQDFLFLIELTKAYYSPSMDALLIKRLNGRDPQTASYAANVMSTSGTPADQAVVEARLNRWVEEWHGLESTAEPAQRMLQVELILALMNAKSWKLPDARIDQFKQSCVSDLCRQYFRRSFER